MIEYSPLAAQQVGTFVQDRPAIVRHQIVEYTDGQLFTDEGALFDADQYSRMKYGSLEAARKIGLELGELVLENVPELIYDERKIISPFMYKHVPSAAYTIAKYAFTHLNAARANIGLDRIHTRQIYITNQPNADYSKLSPDDRIKYMIGSGLQLISEPLEDHNVLLLDDIRITGTYGELVRRLVESHNIHKIIDVYWASVGIQATGIDPQIENAINSQALKMSDTNGLDFITQIIDEEGLVPTLRTIKIILSHPCPEELLDFLSELDSDTLIELYECAAGTGKDLKAMYPQNYELLEAVAKLYLCQPK